METIKFRDWVLEIDRDRTISAYEKVAVGSPEDCDCQDCRAWIRHRPDVYPKSFLNLLLQLGISEVKEADVTAWEPTPTSDGTNRYTGEFVFVGRVVSGPDLFVPIRGGQGFNIVYSQFEANFEIGFSNQDVGFSVASQGFHNEMPVAQLGFATRSATP